MLHWDTNTKCLIGWSRAVGGHWPGSITLGLDAERSLTSRSRSTGTGITYEAPRPIVVGWDYVPVDEEIQLASPDLYSMDPAVAERGLAGHRRTQNALAVWVEGRGLSPLRPSPTDPLFDLAWGDGSRLYVCEVKSTTDGNEERQLRLGLGQVLRYRHWLDREDRTVVAVLSPERRPTDRSWEALCAELGVRLVWPPDFSGLDA